MRLAGWQAMRPQKTGRERETMPGKENLDGTLSYGTVLSPIGNVDL